MRIETRNYTDGSVEAIVVRDDGEMLASLRVRAPRTHDTLEVYLAEAHFRMEDVGTLPERDEGTYAIVARDARIHLAEGMV